MMDTEVMSCGCSDVSIKFLGQRLAEMPHTRSSSRRRLLDPDDQCKRMLKFLGQQKSKKAFRNGWEKNMILDLLPDSDELRICALNRTDVTPDRVHRLSAITGVHFVGRNFAINVKGDAGENMCYAFEVKKKGDYYPLVSSLLMCTQVGVVEETSKEQIAAVEVDTAHIETIKQLTEQRTSLSLQVASLQSMLQSETNKRLVAERDCAVAKSEATEMHAKVGLITAEIATDFAQIKSDELDEDAQLFFDETAAMKNMIAMLGFKMDAYFKLNESSANSDSAKGTGKEEGHLLGNNTSKLQQPRVSHRKESNDKMINLLQRMSSYESKLHTRKSTNDSIGTSSVDTGVYSHDGLLSSNPSQDLTMHEDTNNNNDIASSPSGTVTTTVTATTTKNTAPSITLPVKTEQTEKSSSNTAAANTSPQLSVDEVCAQFRNITSGSLVRGGPNNPKVVTVGVTSTPHLLNEGNGHRDHLTTSPDEPLRVYVDSPKTPRNVPPFVNDTINTPVSFSSRRINNEQNQSFHLQSNLDVTEMADFVSDWIKMTDITAEEIETVNLTKINGRVGFAISGGTDEEVQEGDPAVYVSNIVIDGVAHHDNRLRRGDRVVSVNGVSFESIPHDQATNYITHEDELEIVVSRLPIEDTFNVEFYAVTEKPILELTSDNNECVLSDVSPEAISWVAGHLRQGDRVVSINGETTTNKTLPQWLAMLVPKPKTVMQIVVSRVHEMYSSQNSTLSGQTTIVEDHLEIAFNKTASGLGFSIAGGSDHPVQAGDPSVYVTHIIEDGAAAKDGRLCVGDRLLEVNGINTLSVDHAEAVRALTLNPAGVHMHVSRLPVHEEELIDVEFDLGDGGLGFSVFGGYDQHGDEDPGILILRIAEHGSAARSGALQPGDKIIAVNGVTLGKVTHDEAVTLLGAVTGRIALQIARITEIKKEREIFVDMELNEQPNQGGLGFSVAGGRDHPIDDGDPAIYVTHINEGGIVHRDGQLRFGDKIVRVNGTDLINVTHDEAIEALKSINGKLDLRVARFASPNEESEDILRIEFRVQPGQKLGLRISGGIDAASEDCDTAVYVSEITDGAAATDARLQEGDKILVCNGETFVHITHHSALEALRSNPSEIKLTIARIAEQI